MSQLQIVVFGLILVILIMLGAFFSCAETALMAINRYRLRHKARLKKGYAVRLMHLLKRPDRLLGTILIGNTFANMLASSFATLIGAYYWGDTGALLAAIILTFIVLIFSEIAPKTFAAIYPDQVAKWVVIPIQVIMRVLYPAVWLASTVTNGLLRLCRVTVTGGYPAEALSREELRSIVHETSGKLSRQYQNMLLGILDLNKLTVDAVMIPQHEIVGIDIEQSWEHILAKINKSHQDWMPFYRDNMNQVIGVLYIRDVLRVLLQKKTMNKELLQQFLQEPYFVPEGTALSVQLAYFQRSQEKIAFVVDEYGEIIGLLTLNLILEEIVGSFTAAVPGDKRIMLQTDHSYIVDGSVTVREFNRTTEFDLPLNGPRTINGVIVEYLETLPKTGVSILIGGYPIEIMQVKDNRVKVARIFKKITNE